MLWIKAFHIVFMVTWFAGLFYLPRLFVYHAMATDDASLKRFVIMERKLLFGIMTPSAVLTILSGLWLLYGYGWELFHNMLWIHIKLLFILVLVAYHVYCVSLWMGFKNNANRHSHVFYRWFNEFPVLMLISIVILVTVKPF